MICFIIDCLIFYCRLWSLLNFVQEAEYNSHHKEADCIKKMTVKLNTTKKGSSDCVFLPLGSGVPSQWGWPPDLLLFALVTALSQYSFHHSGTHQQPRTVLRPGWSAWTKSKQITFPCVTDLQLTDRTASQRMTTRHKRDESSLPFPVSPLNGKSGKESAVISAAAAAPSCWSLDRCVKSSSVTVPGPKKLPMPNTEGVRNRLGSSLTIASRKKKNI